MELRNITKTDSNVSLVSKSEDGKESLDPLSIGAVDSLIETDEDNELNYMLANENVSQSAENLLLMNTNSIMSSISRIEQVSVVGETPPNETAGVAHDQKDIQIKNNDLLANKKSEEITSGSPGTALQAIENQTGIELQFINEDTNGDEKKNTDFKLMVTAPSQMLFPSTEQSLNNIKPNINMLSSDKSDILPELSLSNETRDQIEIGCLLYVIKDHHAEELSELELKVGDLVELHSFDAEGGDYWLKGISMATDIRRGQQGYFPKDKVILYDPHNLPPQKTQSNVSVTDVLPEKVEPVPKGTVVTALYPFEASKEDELNFTEGCRIMVIDCPDGGWWRGVIGMEDKNSVTGWFPANLVNAHGDNTAKPSQNVVSPPSPKLESIGLDRKVSWVKRIKSAQDNVMGADLGLRNRSTSAPLKRDIPPDLAAVLPAESKENFKLPISPNRKADVIYELVPLTPDDDPSSRACSPSENMAFEPNRPRGRSGSHLVNRSSILINGPLLVNDVMQGATVETVQDKVSPAIYAHLPAQEKKRLSVIWELIQTERDYVRDLAIVIEMFYKPMASIPSVGPKNMQALFANIEQIFSVNYDFLQILQQVEDIKNINAYAEAFLLMGERFMCYIPFCSSQQANSTKFLKTVLGKSDVKAFLEETYKSPQMRQLDLPGFLLKPVQRICKYPLLLKELIKNTPEEHSDLVVLNRANDKMKSAVSTINESAKKLNGLKPMNEVQGRFAEKINIVNANRFLVREDAIHVVFSDGKKARRLFLFNDLLIFARKDWRDKLHVIEKTPLKDIRVCDIAETGDTSETVLVEVEILPSSDFDFPNRYILSLSSTAEKAAWLDAYKCLVRFHVKSKNINDITMTLSSEDKDNDDEEEQRANTKEVVEEALKAKKFQVDDLETANKDLNSKILLLEKIMKERDAKIREWEDKVLEIEANNRKIVSAKDELISKKDATIKELNSNCEQKTSTIAELESKLLLESQKIQKKEALLDAHYKEQIESTQLLETQLKNQKGNYQKQIKVIEELNLELETCKGLLSDEQASNKKLKAKNHELDTQLIEKDSLLNKAETNLIHLQEENHFSVVKCQEILQVLGINWKMPVSQLVFSDNSRINRHKSGYGLNTTPSFEQLSNRGPRNIVQSASELLDLTRNCVEDLLKAVNEKQNKLNATQEELNIMTEKHTKAKMELSNYESNLNSSSAQYSNLSHKLTEAENRLQELKRSIDAKQKEFEQMEETNSAQINNQKRSLSEKELKIETLSASLSNETEKSRNLSKEIEYYRGQIDDYKNQCGIQKDCIQEQLSKLKRLQEDLAQKEKENVELQEKNASNLKIISEIQNLIKKAHSESSLEFEVSGGVIAQVRSFSSAAIELSINTKKQLSEISTNLNGVRSTLAQKTDALCTLEQNFEKKSAELIETTLLLTKRTEKLSSLKEELEETKDALLSATNALNQVKHALEQTRANVEHFKLTNASLERQQKQIQLALDESRKEVLDVHERNKQQQVIIQKLSDSVSIAEDKMIQLNVNFREKEIALENALKQGKELEIQNIELEEKQSAMVKRLEVKEQDLKELDQKLHHSLKLTDEKSDDSARNIKSLLESLSQVEAKLKEEHAKSAAEKDRLKHDLEREITHLKLQITESETNCLSFQQKLQQKESKLIEFDQQLKDAKFKLHDTELNMSSLQNKVELKEAKVHELEVSLTHISSNNDKLKQKISENEIQLLNSHSKISEYESKLQRAENNTISLESTISAKDQRIAEYKNQIDAQSDLTNKLEREKKELSRQMEDMTNHNTIVTKELQDIKKKFIDTELELSKTKNSLENLSRDSQREMNFLEEKHKAILSKSHQEKELALSALYSEFNAYKQSSIAEGNRIKCENEESLRNLEKSHQIAITEVKKKLENSIEECISLQLKHKGDLTEKTEGLKLEKTNEIEQIRTKYTVMVDMLKGNISDINGKLGDYERAINARDASLKTLEVENVKLSIEKNKLQDEIFALKEKAIKFEEGHYVKLKTLQRDLEEKTESLVKNANTIEELNSQINSLEKSLERNNSILEKEKENYDLMSKQAKMLSDKLISLEESRNAQILKLQNDLIDLEREAHEKQVQLEKLEAREAANAETIENLKQSIAQLKDMGEEKSRYSESTKKEMGHVEKKVNELNSILVAKDKVIESLEIAVKNGLSELNLKEEVVTRVTAKLATTEEQLINLTESKTILELELEKLNHETKRKLDSEKEASRKHLKDTKKKYATSLNELELKLTNEAKILSEKLKVEHDTLINKQQSLNQMKIEGLQKVIDDNAGEIGKLIDEIKILTQQNEQIQIKYCELRGREDNQLNDLKDKALAITQLKKRLQIAENESLNHCQATQILKAELDSAKCNLITLQSEYQELLLREQRGALELEYSKKCTTQLELKLTELEQSRDSFKALQITYEEQSKCLSKSEHQISNLQKLISRQTKLLASVQITLLEISNIVDIQLPWRIEDIMILPERIRASFKSSKAKVPFEIVETNVLLNLVTAVREVAEERQKLIETLESELRKTKALEQSNSEAKSNLANVSDAISAIELRVQQERREQKEEIENFQTKLQDMESLLDKALGDKTKLEKLCERLKQELNSLSEEKILLEKDYVQVYEKFQSAKVAFVERSKAISADTTAIVEDNKRFKLELTAKSNMIKELETLTGDLQNETAKYMEQKKELDKLLNAAKIEISSLSKQLQFQSIEKQQLEKSIKDQEQKYQDEVMCKETEINELYEKYKGAESKIAFLAESLENSQRILQDFKDKWSESIKREKELEKRNTKLFTEIKTYEGRIDEVEKGHNDSAKAHSLALEEKCKLLEAENNTLRTEKMVSDLKLSSRRYTFSKEPLTTERSIPRQLPDPRAEFLNQKQSMPDIKLDFPVKIFPDKIISDDDER